MAYGEGKLTTIHDRVNFYKDVYNDPGVHFEREGNKISLVTGKGIVFNDKLIIHSEDALNHAFDTYKPLQNHLNKNQQIVLEWLKEQVSNGETLQYILWELTDNAYEEPAMGLLSAYTKAWLELEEAEQFQLLAALAEWGMKQ